MKSIRASFLIVVATVLAAGASTLVVDAYGGGDYTTIQPALDAAASGDSVLVMAGNYTGPENRDLDFGGKALTLLAPDGAESTSIDCEGLGRGIFFHNGEGADSRVVGFTFTQGYSGTGGGAVYCYLASPTLSDCRFIGNDSPQGGAVYALGSGTGMLIENCNFEGNHSDYGGAIYATGILAPTIEACSFEGNSSDLKGGAVYCTNQSSGLVSACSFHGNSSLAGGAVFLNISSSPHIIDCTFDENTADDGGGIAAFNSCQPTIENCTFVNNSAGNGGSLHMDFLSNATILQCIMAFGLTGNVMYCGSSTPETYHNLIWGNGGGDLLCGNYHDNIYENPQFCDVGHHGPYTLQSDSPAAPANNPYGVLMGAWPVDCDESAAEDSTWSELKEKY